MRVGRHQPTPNDLSDHRLGGRSPASVILPASMNCHTIRSLLDRPHFVWLALAPLVLTSILASCPPLRAEEDNTPPQWTMFRGPNGSGRLPSAQLPERFGLESNVAWVRDLPAGHSSPVLFAERIFLTGTEGEQLFVLALDRDDGRELWRREVPRPRRETIDPRSGPAAASPVVDDRRIVTFFGEFGLIAHDHEGNELWRLALGPFNNIYGTGSSPILVGDRVFLCIDQQRDSFLLAVDAGTGKEVWRTPRPEAKSGHSTPIVWTPEDSTKPQILVTGSFLLTAYDPADGSRIWWVGGLPFEMKSTPVAGDGLLFIHGYGSPYNDAGRDVVVPTWEQASAGDEDGDGRLAPGEIAHAVAREWLDFVDLDTDGHLDADDWAYLRAALASRNSMMAIRLPGALATGDLSEEHVVWQAFRRVPQLPSPLLTDDALWMVNDRGLTTVFQPASGHILAQGRIEGLIDSIYASPIAVGDRVFVIGRSGKIAVLSSVRAREGDLTPLFVTDLDETIVATPALDERSMYVRTRSRLFAFRATNP